MIYKWCHRFTLLPRYRYIYMYLLENTRYALAIIGSPCNKLPQQGSLGISRTTQAWYSDDNLRCLLLTPSPLLGSFSPTYRDLLLERAKRETANRRYLRANQYRRKRLFPFRYPVSRKVTRSTKRWKFSKISQCETRWWVLHLSLSLFHSLYLLLGRYYRSNAFFTSCIVSEP